MPKGELIQYDPEKKMILESGKKYTIVLPIHSVKVSFWEYIKPDERWVEVKGKWIYIFQKEGNRAILYSEIYISAEGNYQCIGGEGNQPAENEKISMPRKGIFFFGISRIRLASISIEYYKNQEDALRHRFDEIPLDQNSNYGILDSDGISFYLFDRLSEGEYFLSLYLDEIEKYKKWDQEKDRVSKRYLVSIIYNICGAEKSPYWSFVTKEEIHRWEEEEKKTQKGFQERIEQAAERLISYENKEFFEYILKEYENTEEEAKTADEIYYEFNANLLLSEKGFAFLSNQYQKEGWLRKYLYQIAKNSIKTGKAFFKILSLMATSIIVHEETAIYKLQIMILSYDSRLKLTITTSHQHKVAIFDMQKIPKNFISPEFHKNFEKTLKILNSCLVIYNVVDKKYQTAADKIKSFLQFANMVLDMSSFFLKKKKEVEKLVLEEIIDTALVKAQSSNVFYGTKLFSAETKISHIVGKNLLGKVTTGISSILDTWNAIDNFQEGDVDAAVLYLMAAISGLGVLSGGTIGIAFVGASLATGIAASILDDKALPPKIQEWLERSYWGKKARLAGWQEHIEKFYEMVSFTMTAVIINDFSEKPASKRMEIEITMPFPFWMMPLTKLEVRLKKDSFNYIILDGQKTLQQLAEEKKPDILFNIQDDKISSLKIILSEKEMNLNNVANDLCEARLDLYGNTKFLIPFSSYNSTQVEQKVNRPIQKRGRDY
ncbi:MAG: hypothetical protein HUU50_00215 [Candidatus Brocadiae bacterium]|nr:hypothetical protein [Candidatus Brocadiia bacterium]